MKKTKRNRKKQRKHGKSSLICVCVLFLLREPGCFGTLHARNTTSSRPCLNFDLFGHGIQSQSLCNRHCSAFLCDSACIHMHTNPLIFTSQLKHTLSQAFILSQANCGLIALIVRRARSVSAFVWSLFEKLYQHSKHNSQD